MSGNPFMRLVTGFGDQGQESAQIDAWWWATVMDAGTGWRNIRVQRDAPDTVPLTARLESLMPVKVGDRVRVHNYRGVPLIIGTFGGGFVPPEPEDLILHMGQWNIRYASAAADTGNRAWSYRKPRMAQTVVGAGVDILTVQEADYIGTAQYQALDLAQAMQAVSKGKVWKVLDFGSRNAVIYNQSVWVWTGVGRKEPSVWAERELVWGIFRHVESGARVIVGADHWHPDNAATRRQQAVDSHQVLSSLQSRYGLTTVSGVDTNDYGPTEGQAIAAMRGMVFQDLRQVFPAATRSGWPTWHDWKANPPWSAEGQSKNEWLDQIFVSAPARAMYGGIYDTTLPLTNALYSDHHLLRLGIVVDTGSVPVSSDSGWLSHGGTWASGYRQSVNYPVQFRIKDGVVFWRGVVEKVSGNLETGYVLTGITSDAVPISGSGGYPLTTSVDVRYGSISAGVYPQNGGGLYVYVEGPLTSVRLGGSYPVG